MVIPQGLGVALEKEVADIVAMMYEDVTVDNEDCKSSGLLIRVVLSTFPTGRLDDQRFCSLWIYEGLKTSCHCRKHYNKES
jgi:hypothetical protein